MTLQSKKIEPLQSTELSPESLPLKTPEHLKDLLHRTCKTLSLYAFIEAYCNDDLSFLVIKGEPTQAELEESWQEILVEYSGLIKNEQSGYIFDLGKQITLLQLDINYLDRVVHFLHYRYDEEIADQLRCMGFSLDAKYGTEEYTNELDMIVSLATTKVFDLGELEEEYKRLNNTATGKKQTEEDLLMTIAALSKYQGYHINKKETTVLEFASIFNLYLKELAHSKKDKGNG